MVWIDRERDDHTGVPVHYGVPYSHSPRNRTHLEAIQSRQKRLNPSYRWYSTTLELLEPVRFLPRAGGCEYVIPKGPSALVGENLEIVDIPDWEGQARRGKRKARMHDLGAGNFHRFGRP